MTKILKDVYFWKDHFATPKFKLFFNLGKLRHKVQLHTCMHFLSTLLPESGKLLFHVRVYTGRREG